MVRFNCPSCNKKLMVPDEYSGQKAKCPKCGQTTVVPSPSVRQTDTVDGVIEEMVRGDTDTISSSAHQNTTQPDLTPADNIPFIDAEERNIRISHAATPLFPSVKPQTTLGAPNYGGVKVLGMLYIGCGWFCCILGVLAFIFFTALGNGMEWERSFGTTPGWVVGVIFGVFFIVVGVFSIGIGQLFYCIRDLTQNSFHLKRL